MISKLAVNRPVSMIMILAAIVILGFVSIFSIPQALTPDIDYPYAIAMITYPGAGPEEVETSIAEPMEGALVAIEGVKDIQTISSDNMCIAAVEFESGTDLNFATLDIREKLSMISSTLPDDASSPTIVKLNMNSMPIMQLYFTSDKTIPELQEFIEEDIESRFERISGVASLTQVGATESVIEIKFDQDKLTGYGLSMSTISSMLSAENISYPCGEITNGGTEISVKTFGEFANVDEIAALPITLADGSIITLDEVADISQTSTDADTITRINGQDGIGIYISKSSDANIVEVSEKVQEVIDELNEEYGDTLNVTIGYDQADYIKTSLSSVAHTAVQGAILAILVIFLFLRNMGSTLVIGISIPASVLATFCVMKAMDMSLNLMTLGSLTLAIGMVVDNSVVVLENIFRRKKMGLSAREASINGSNEVVVAVLASTLTSIVIYLPIALSGGLAGLMFKSFAYTIIAALTCSFLVAVTIVPMLCSKLLAGSASEDYIRIGRFFYRYRIVIWFTRFIDAMIGGYRRVVRKALRARKRTLVLFIVLFALSCGLLNMVGMELIPESDEGSFTITVEMPYGTDVNDQSAYMAQIEEYVLQQPEVDTIALTAGSTGSSLISAGNSISVTLVDAEERSRSTEEVMNDVKDKFKDLAGADISYDTTSSISISSGADLTLNIKGDDIDSVTDDAAELCNELKKLDCVSEIENGSEEGNPEVKVILNRTTAAHYGLTTYTVATGLSNALSGSTSTELKVDGDSIDVNLLLSDSYAQSVEDMKSILISTPTGQEVPVGQVADLEFDNAPVSITRINQEMVDSLNITFKDGIDVDDGTEKVTDIADKFVFDDGVSYDTGGVEEEMMDAFKNLGIAMAVAVALVYIVMAAQFESFILPLMVMMSIPFAMSGAFLALFLTAQKLSMTSFIGLIMLVGIVVNNAILLVEFIGQNKKTMGTFDAIAEAGAVRMRPILMTTLTTVIGMLPMALGIGEGTETMVPMAICIIGGLTASTIVTLFLIPVLYYMIDDHREKAGRKRKAKREVNTYREALWLAKEAEKRERRHSGRKEKQNS